MTGLAGFVIKRKKLIIIFGAVLTLIFLVCFFLTPVNYNIMDYLPEKANSTVAINLMTDEFGVPLPNLNVMVKDVPLMDAQETKTLIKNANSVDEVLWLDDVIDLKQPLEIQPTDTVEAYYKDGNALYTVTVKEGEERTAIASIREALDGNCFFSGTAADQASGQDLAMEQTIRAIIFLVPILVGILILFSGSWIEPLFYILTLVVSLFINLGTNIFLGEISYVTLATGPILQIAVSLDYSVFLLHSFRKHRAEGLSTGEALQSAIRESGKSVVASMLTTLFGFMALMFMQYQIGIDMGIVLVKGILISFVCSLTFFPALLVIGEKAIDKTTHRSFVTSFNKVGSAVMKCRIPVALIIAVIMVPTILASNRNNYFYGRYDKTPPGSDIYEIEQVFGTNGQLVLLVPRGDSVSETELCKELGEMPHITSVTSYATMVSNKIPEAYLDRQVVDQFYSENYVRIIMTVNVHSESDESFALVENVRKLADSYYPESCYSCGENANMYDLKNCIEHDNIIVEFITLISIFLVLLFMTKNFLTPLLLITTIKCSIWLNMCVPYFMGDGLSYMGYLIVSTIQMGATVDYAIYLTNTYYANRESMPPKEAMKNAISQAFSSILISCATLALCGFALQLSSADSLVQVLGGLLGRGAIFALAMVMLLLPVLLLATEKIVRKTGFGKNK